MTFLTNMIVLLSLLLLFNILTSFILYKSGHSTLLKYNLFFCLSVMSQLIGSTVGHYLNIPIKFEGFLMIGCIGWPLNFFGLKILHEVNNLPFKAKYYHLFYLSGLCLTASLSMIIPFTALMTVMVICTIIPAVLYTLKIITTYKGSLPLSLPLSIVFLLTLVHMLDYPFLRSIESIAPIGFMIYSCLYLGFSILLPSTLLLRATKEYSTTLEQDQFKLRELVIKKNEQLVEVHDQLDEISIEACKTELVTGVLHNVGNVLNSINLSADILKDEISSHLIDRLHQAVSLISENIRQSPNYLTDDPKGKLALKYLCEISQSFHTNQKKLLSEVISLQDNVDHIKNIISIQQSVGGHRGTIEALSLDSMITQAITINLSSLKKYDIIIEKLYKKDVMVHADKFKLLQILINLISNAKHALHKTQDRKISIDISLLESELVRISVQDNGEGIEQDHLAKVFRYGFTTKKEGHGFGLHSSLHSAKSLGGNLIAASHGPGHGANFVLELPLVPLENS